MKYFSKKLNFFRKRKVYINRKQQLILSYRGSKYKARPKSLPKQKKRILLRYQMLRYFNIITSHQYMENSFSLFYKSNRFNKPYNSVLEFQISTIILRSGFLENGYMADHFSRKGFFLINGLPTFSGLQQCYV